MKSPHCALHCAIVVYTSIFPNIDLISALAVGSSIKDVHKSGGGSSRSGHMQTQAKVDIHIWFKI